MALVEIVVGSQSDLPSVEGSGMIGVLKDCGVQYNVNVISAHRNPEELAKFCKEAKGKGVKVIIAAAGMAAALPGTIGADTNFSLPIISVPLPSAEFPDALDAFHAMARMPGGCPLAVTTGIGKAGLSNAAMMAVLILSLGGDIVSQVMGEKLSTYRKNQTKAAQIPAKIEA